jgi:drug/metabolite transporter (DMT)-like permease
MDKPSRLSIIVAFALVYVIWGSTYLGIRIAIETIPPLLMAGVRFLLAGSILFVIARRRDHSPISRIHWRSAFIVGALMLAFANGGVTWAEQKLDSGLAALLVTMVPFWMVLLDWNRRGNRPSRPVILGLITGFMGVLLLIGPDQIVSGESQIDLIGVGVILVATMCWASGSILSKQVELPKTPITGTSMEMLSGGAVLLVGSLFTGDWTKIEFAAISAKSLLAVLYLIIFGSIVAFTAYIWLLKNVSAARVGTYAYVNPIVALFLGWSLADETITVRTIIATAIVISSVALITIYRTKPAPQIVEPVPTLEPVRFPPSTKPITSALGE